MKNKPKKLEYKSFPFEVKEFRQDEKYFYFEGYLSTFGNEDRGGDVVVKGAFIASLKEHSPSLFWSHDSKEPLGIFDEIYEDEVGLYVKGKMPLNDTLVSGRIIPQMEIGSIKSMSIGYSIWGEKGCDFEKDIRYLRKLYLWEGSLVTIPMNDQAVLKSKSIGFQNNLPISEKKQGWNKIEAKERVLEKIGGDLTYEAAQEEFKRAFLWCDDENAEHVDSYKLLIADVVDGKLTIIPKGVFAAAGSISGIKGGVNISEDAKELIKETINEYYSQLDMESPFGKTFRIDDFKSLDERVMESLFHNGVRTSNKLSKTLVSFIKAGLARNDESSEKRDADNWDDTLNLIESLNDTIGGN